MINAKTAEVWRIHHLIVHVMVAWLLLTVMLIVEWDLLLGVTILKRKTWIAQIAKVKVEDVVGVINVEKGVERVVRHIVCRIVLLLLLLPVRLPSLVHDGKRCLTNWDGGGLVRTGFLLDCLIKDP